MLTPATCLAKVNKRRPKSKIPLAFKKEQTPLSFQNKRIILEDSNQVTKPAGFRHSYSNINTKFLIKRQNILLKKFCHVNG